MQSKSILAAVLVLALGGAAAADPVRPAYNPQELVRGLSPGITVPKTAEVKQLEPMFAQPDKDVDFARAVLTIDKMVDPAIDIEANLKVIEAMAETVRSMAGPNAKSWDRMLALRRYLYEKGSWNEFRAFQYDFDDPLGTKIANKLIPNYIATRKGNCISMPFLFIALGQRLGLDVRASTAPLHVFVKYTDPDTGRVYNLETTSGAGPTRHDWYRQHMPMTDEAIANGLYLQRLTMTETLVVMSTVVAEHRYAQRDFEGAIAQADLALKHYPKDVSAMLRKGAAHYALLKKHFLGKYATMSEIPPDRREYYRQLSEGNGYWFAKAETLGWREPTPESEEKYKRAVEGAETLKK